MMEEQQEDKNVSRLKVVITGKEGSSVEGASAEVRRVHPERTHSKPNERVTLEVLVPPIMGMQESSMLLGLLLDEFEKLPGEVVLESVCMNNLHITKEGIQDIEMFIVTHGNAITELSLNQMMYEQFTETETEAVSSLLLAFQNAPIEKLDLSRNFLGPSLWRLFVGHNELTHLILDDVRMTEESLQELALVLNVDNLTSLHVALSPCSLDHPSATDAFNELIRRCFKLQSLKWINRDPSCRLTVPWKGVRDLAMSVEDGVNECNLRHVFLEGGQFPREAFAAHGLESTFFYIKNLSSLRLRRLNLTSIAIGRIVDSLCRARHPIEVLDLSQNGLDSNVVGRLCMLTKERRVMPNLRTLDLRYNRLSEDDAVTLYEHFVTRSFGEIEVLLQHNQFNLSRLPIALAIGKSQAEEERVELRKQRDKLREETQEQLSVMRKLAAGQSAMLKEMQSLKAEVRRVEEERDALARAYHVLGLANKFVAEESLEDRITRLERSVLAKSSRSSHQNRNSEEASHGSNSSSDDNERTVVTSTLSPTKVNQFRSADLSTVNIKPSPRDTLSSHRVGSRRQLLNDSSSSRLPPRKPHESVRTEYSSIGAEGGGLHSNSRLSTTAERSHRKEAPPHEQIPLKKRTPEEIKEEMKRTLALNKRVGSRRNLLDGSSSPQSRHSRSTERGDTWRSSPGRARDPDIWNDVDAPPSNTGHASSSPPQRPQIHKRVGSRRQLVVEPPPS